MLRKPGARILVPLLSVTALNVAILLVNLSFPSRAAVANMDYFVLWSPIPILKGRCNQS